MSSQERDVEGIPPPFVAIPGLANFRDIGGWPIADEKGNVVAAVRPGVIFRGPDTATVTDEGVVKLRELGVRSDLDLRSKGQIEKAGGFRELPGIERIWAPAFPDGEYSPEKAARRYVLYASDGTEVGFSLLFSSLLSSRSFLLRLVGKTAAAMSPPSEPERLMVD